MITRWQYAASPINWCNDDLLDLGDEYSVTDILGDMQALGFVGTELGRKYPRTVNELKPLLQAYGLQLASGWAQIHLTQRDRWDEELSRYRQHVKFLKAMGADVVVTAEGSGSVHWDVDGDRPHKILWDQTTWQTVLEGLQRAGALCAEEGLTLVYHPHLGTNIETRADVVRLLDNTPADLVSLVVDTGHLSVAGIDPAWVISQYPERIGHVHMKSVRPLVATQYDQGLGFLECVRRGIFTVPGDGAVDFAPIVKALQQMGYSGWCVIEAEQDPLVAEPVAAMRTALTYLHKLTETSEIEPSHDTPL
ncbi:MAG: myo-inosose-2 dehydratase [Sulfobacillus acidophilus]|uniref:Myo-inosose-2 dehydratase n=1 Tax=Sulfobacillus acidophilus TaxID=53633 RepID=A0A2T2WN24_9FIRM|nr:MAG: myo-inosose-2 dehydratase [Sulfobacillus acidophilus]